MNRITLEVPQGPTFAADEMSAEREARLLVAGAFPDKGLTMSPDDIDGIVARSRRRRGAGEDRTRRQPLDPLGLVKRVGAKARR